MSIVLNEREWAAGVIADRKLGKKPVETLNRVARYYLQCEGYPKKEVRNKLEDFLLQCDPNVVLIKWSDTLDGITKAADKYKLIELDGIDVTEAELDIIQTLRGKQAQRLAFTLLCTAKYWDAAQPKNNSWVNTPDKEIMSMANLNTSVKRQNLMLHEMRNAGLLKFGKRVDSLNIQVQFIKRDSPVAIHITDFRNLGNQYLMFCGEPFIQCAHCGITIKRHASNHKYCPECATEIYVKKSVESVMRRRSS